MLSGTAGADCILRSRLAQCRFDRFTDRVFRYDEVFDLVRCGRAKTHTERFGIEAFQRLSFGNESF